MRYPLFGRRLCNNRGALAIKVSVDLPGHRVRLEWSPQKLDKLLRHHSRLLQEIVIMNIDIFHARGALQPLLDLPQVKSMHQGLSSDLKMWW